MNSPLIKIFRTIIVLLLLLSLASCGQSIGVASFMISSNTYVIEAGEDIDVQTLIDMFVTDTEATSDTTEPLVTEEPPVATEQIDVVITPDTSEATSDTAEENTNSVYWVKGGEVWHTRSTCPSLSRSKNILSGTVEDAVLAGKVRVCKRCGT